MFIKTVENIEAGTLIDVRLSLPGGKIFKRGYVEFLGKVVRREEPTAVMDSGIGIIILHMDTKDMERLEKHLKKHGSKSA
jgi:hypothetical protein